MNMIGSVVASIGAFLGAMAWLSGLLLHVYTIIIAFQISGFFAAVLTFVFPFISQAYWTWKTWSLSGVFMNNYTYWVVACIGYWAVGFLLVLIGGALQGAAQRAGK